MNIYHKKKNINWVLLDKERGAKILTMWVLFLLTIFGIKNINWIYPVSHVPASICHWALISWKLSQSNRLLTTETVISTRVMQ